MRSEYRRVAGEEVHGEERVITSVLRWCILVDQRTLLRWTVMAEDIRGHYLGSLVCRDR